MRLLLWSSALETLGSIAADLAWKGGCVVERDLGVRAESTCRAARESELLGAELHSEQELL